MDKLYKTQLIDIVSEKAYLSREDSKAAINAFIEEIEEALLQRNHAPQRFPYRL